MSILLSQLGSLFSILHDGVIQSHSFESGNLALEVKIQYLAKRIDPRFTGFSVVLKAPAHMRFSTWPLRTGAEAIVLTDPEEIFRPDLDILEGSIEDGQLKIVCNQSDPSYGYCGGELRLTTSGAEIRDEAGRVYEIGELGEIAEQYWDEWSAKGRA